MALHTSRYRVATLLVLCLTGVATVAAVSGQTPTDGTTSSGNLTVLAAQGVVADDITDDSDVRALRGDGTLEVVDEGEPVVTGDTIVLQIHSEQVNATFTATTGTNTTDRFYRMLDESDTNMTVRALVGPNRQPYDIALNESDTHVVHDRANATLSVVVDSRTLALVERDTRDPIAFEPSVDEFVVEVETHTNSRTDAFEDKFTFYFPDATVDSTTADLRFGGNGPARVDANTTTLDLSGQTNLRPGTTITVEAVDPSGATIATAVVTTSETRSEGANREAVQSAFSATLRDVPSDEYEWFRLRATGQDRTVWERDVIVGPEPRWSNLSATALGTDGEDWTLRVTVSFRLPDPGILEVKLRTDGGLVTQEASVPDGQSSQSVYIRNVSSLPDGPIELETHWDRAGDGRLVFQEDPRFVTSANVPRGTSDQLFARLSIDGADELRDRSTATTTAPPTTAPRTTTASQTNVASESPTTAITDSPTASTEVTETTGEDSPGFGASVTILGVALALLVATRRA
ncbi:PGF-CTERM sorting domain-containing protein [Haloarcula sp. 1CSR25-25]|uniref:PGF-CTERM sorting domain-containing protein n=1 Tax=Haloarcula sp. 1CSR25-25 TaxID=2862545 RepID=UPI002893D087|nr:PGF-CTERM sorting domain-containing protein [Haloarcula sp. 1CSR25-25]MDT3435531.1 PGF-CTERM sorting domain-containing protein [Haloarcula sp. 1CSR25-25]